MYQVDVDALEVRDLGQGGVGAGDERRHGEHGGDAERDARRRRVAVQPERHPRQDDDRLATPVESSPVQSSVRVERRCRRPRPSGRQDDDERRRDVDLDDVVAETAHEVELARQSRVVT